MAEIIFYEKPGCSGNARQKALLRRAGHQIEVRDMLRAGWTPMRLRTFFGKRPVAEWFNLSAPRVKSGEIAPETLSESEALDLMCADPILIRRPLIFSGGRYAAGFETEVIEAWLGLTGAEHVGEGCPRAARTEAERVNDWAASHTLQPHEVDCVIAVMLKILDGKCKINAEEKVTMAALYDATLGQEGLRLGPEMHEMIATARKAGDDKALLFKVYEIRVLAETMISRPVMKAFKTRLRDEELLKPKVQTEDA